MSPSSEIQANFEALSQLAARVDAIHTAFAGMPQHPAADAGEVGEGNLAQALDHFFSDWSQGRQQIEQKIQVVSQDVLYALKEYVGAERAVLAIEPATGALIGALATDGASVISAVLAGASVGQQEEVVGAGASGGVGAASQVAVSDADLAPVVDVEAGPVAMAPGPVFVDQSSGVASEIENAVVDADRVDDTVEVDEQVPGEEFR
jgi:hypothetical protein